MSNTPNSDNQYRIDTYQSCVARKGKYGYLIFRNDDVAHQQHPIYNSELEATVAAVSAMANVVQNDMHKEFCAMLRKAQTPRENGWCMKKVYGIVG